MVHHLLNFTSQQGCRKIEFFDCLGDHKKGQLRPLEEEEQGRVEVQRGQLIKNSVEKLRMVKFGWIGVVVVGVVGAVGELEILVDLEEEGLDGLDEFGKGDLISNVIEKALLNLTISRVPVVLEVPVRFKDRFFPPAVLDLNDEVLIELADFEGKINGTDQTLDRLLLDLAVHQKVALE